MNLLNPANPHHQLLREKLQPYIDEATAPATRRAYKNDLAHFRAWGGTLPASVEDVAGYLAHYGDRLAPATLQRRLAAISRAHDTLGLPNPVKTELVRLTLRGICRKRGTAQRQARPLVKEDILLILTGIGEGCKAVRDAALLLIGFAGAFRRSELVGLNVEDLEFVHQGVIIHLKRSKTDQEGQGRKVGIPYGRGHVCPVKALQTWLAEAGLTSGPLFRPITRHGKLADTRLTDQSVAQVVKTRAAHVGLRAEDLSGHSLRAGLATSAAQAGVPLHKIRAQTGHASDAMLQRYVRDGDLFNNSAGGLF
jgi:integrase